jgi:hypothetical protein
MLQRGRKSSAALEIWTAAEWAYVIFREASPGLTPKPPAQPPIAITGRLRTTHPPQPGARSRSPGSHCNASVSPLALWPVWNGGYPEKSGETSWRCALRLR